MTTKLLSDIAAVGTFLGVIFAGWQLWLNRQQAKTEFEDRMTERYRALAAELPVEVFFDLEVDLEIVEAHRAVFYRYFDLCNEQAFLFGKGRVRKPTWDEWRDGIEGNMKRSGFSRAWHDEIEPHIGVDFQEFKELLSTLPGLWVSGGPADSPGAAGQ